MVGKYKKKPVVIEALKWDGKNIDEVKKFCSMVRAVSKSGKLLYIDTLEGIITAREGDFIIKGVNGEFYPCKPDIFLKTYDEVRE